MLRPAAIDPAATGRAIGGREREPFVAQELEKSRFERRERDVNVPVNNSAELPRARTRRPASEHGLDAAWGSSVADPSLVAGACECIDREHGRDVDKGARHCRNGDPADDRRVAGIECTRPVCPDSVNAAFGQGHDLGCWSSPLYEPQQMRGCKAAQQRALPAGQDSSQIARFDAGRSVPDAIHPAVLAEQAAGPNAPSDLIRRDPGAK